MKKFKVILTNKEFFIEADNFTCDPPVVVFYRGKVKVAMINITTSLQAIIEVDNEQA